VDVNLFLFALKQIRLYPRDCKLDNTFASTGKVPSQILLLNTFSNLVIVLCADSHIVIYSIEQKNVQQGLSIHSFGLYYQFNHNLLIWDTYGSSLLVPLFIIQFCARSNIFFVNV